MIVSGKSFTLPSAKRSVSTNLIAFLPFNPISNKLFVTSYNKGFCLVVESTKNLKLCHT